ncbi:MAG: NUDIX domain-containing protein [Candidatus Latescibacteria bacterium]|jgi:8-oxo-dGTP pyrophosphatase MutT (NUDIX family)|nr:NUDIX domain-containing protein [Candidatus Latescibacterota bacterium]
MITALATQERRATPIPSFQTKVKVYQQGVHVHLFGINEEQQIISALILKRADNGLHGIVSGKMKHGETILTAAYRETHEETGLIPLALFDTGKRFSIQCNKYEFHVSVFSGLIPHNSPIKLNYENTDYTYVPTVFSPCHIEIIEQRKNQIFCINKVREMYQAMMN